MTESNIGSDVAKVAESVCSLIDKLQNNIGAISNWPRDAAPIDKQLSDITKIISDIQSIKEEQWEFFASSVVEASTTVMKLVRKLCAKLTGRIEKRNEEDATETLWTYVTATLTHLEDCTASLQQLTRLKDPNTTERIEFAAKVSIIKNKLNTVETRHTKELLEFELSHQMDKPFDTGDEKWMLNCVLKLYQALKANIEPAIGHSDRWGGIKITFGDNNYGIQTGISITPVTFYQNYEQH